MLDGLERREKNRPSHGIHAGPEPVGGSPSGSGGPKHLNAGEAAGSATETGICGRSWCRVSARWSGRRACFDPPHTTAIVPVDRYGADRTSAVLTGSPGTAIRQWTAPNQPWPVPAPGDLPHRGQVAEHGHFSPTVGLVRGAGSGELGGSTFWPAALPVEWVSRRSEGVLSRPAGNEFADLWTAGLTEDEYMATASGDDPPARCPGNSGAVDR